MGTNAVTFVRSSHRLAPFSFPHTHTHTHTLSLSLSLSFSLYSATSEEHLLVHRQSFHEKQAKITTVIHGASRSPTSRKLTWRLVLLHPAVNFQRILQPLSFEALWFSMGVRKRAIFFKDVLEKTCLRAEKLNARLGEIHHSPTSRLLSKLGTCFMAVFGNYIRVLLVGEAHTVGGLTLSSNAGNPTLPRLSRWKAKRSSAASSPRARPISTKRTFRVGHACQIYQPFLLLPLRPRR